MIDPVQTALIFLIRTVFDLYLFVLVTRLILVWVGADFYNPLTQFIVKLTDPLVRPLRKRIPNYRRLETTTLILIFLFEVIKYLLLLAISVSIPNPIGVMIFAFADMLKLILEIFFYGILIQVILSWVQPHSPLNRVLYQLTSPIMNPIRRIVPPINGIDISPIPALLLLQLLLILIVGPLLALGGMRAVLG